MAAERCGAAALDRTHHLELAEADMAGIGAAPCRSMAAEDIRHLQLWARHLSCASGGWFGLGLSLSLLLRLCLRLRLRRRRSRFGHQRGEAIQRARDLADGVGGDAGVERRRIEAGVTEQNLNHSDIDILFEQMGRKAVAQGMRGHPLADRRPSRRRRGRRA